MTLSLVTDSSIGTHQVRKPNGSNGVQHYPTQIPMPVPPTAKAKSTKQKTQNVAILGCTGSVGSQALDVIRFLSDQFRPFALAAGRNSHILNQQIQQFQPKMVSVADENVASQVEFSGAVRHGLDAVLEMVTHPEVDMVVVASSGTLGLRATLAALKAGKEVLLANKEALVVGGELVMPLAAQKGITLRTIDTEHNALWQCLVGENMERVSQLLITASGGPFRTWPLRQIKYATPQQALQHPKWQMGYKITIDSASLINKGLEVIEAKWLFGLELDRVQAYVHPECIVHGLVEFTDGAVKALLGGQDLRHAVHYALLWPDRGHGDYARLPWNTINSMVLNFEKPDKERWPGLELAYQAGIAGHTYPAVLVAADELLVDLFVEGKIGFMDIPAYIDRALTEHTPQPVSLESIEETMVWTKERVHQMVQAAQ